MPTGTQTLIKAVARLPKQLRNVRYLPLDLKNSCVMFAICNFISQKATITNERKPMLIRTTEFAQTKRRLQVANDNLSTHTTLRVQA